MYLLRHIGPLQSQQLQQKWAEIMNRHGRPSERPTKEKRTKRAKENHKNAALVGNEHDSRSNEAIAGFA